MNPQIVLVYVGAVSFLSLFVLSVTTTYLYLIYDYDKRRSWEDDVTCRKRAKYALLYLKNHITHREGFRYSLIAAGTFSSVMILGYVFYLCLLVLFGLR